MKYIKPKNINKVLIAMRKKIIELLQTKNDRGFWYDHNKHYDMRHTPLINKSNKIEDKRHVFNEDIEKVAMELIQIALFGRILKTDDEDNIDNLPKNTLPYFMKQTIGKHEKDLYDINSQAVFMNIYEKNSNLNMIRKVVASKKPRHRKRK